MLRITCAVATIFMMTFIVLTATSAEAQTLSNLDRIERSQGQVLKWDGRWVRSNEDQNVIYLVERVRVKNVPPLRRVTLELVTNEAASRKKRTLVIETEEKARVIVQRLSEKQRELRMPGERDTVFGGDSSDPLTKPFIRYSPDGWVRAKQPNATARLSICRVHHREFSCLSEEKTRYGVMLRTVEEEIRWSGH